MLWQSVGLAGQVDAQPITYFLAYSGTRNMVDLSIVPNSWTSHESFPVRLTAVNTHKAMFNLRAIILQARGTQVGPKWLAIG
jgi:hypothetical protein